MNSLERARQFLAQKASRLALAIVPLAALAISTPSAKARPITTSGSFASNPGDCFVTGTGAAGSCGTSIAGAVGGNTNLNWIAMFGSGNAVGSGDTLDFSADAPGSGTLPAGSVPVAWDFTVNQLTSQDPTVDWNVAFRIVMSTTGSPYSFTQSGSASTGSVVSGTGSIIIPSGGSLVSFIMDLNTSASGGGFPYGINIPGGATLDLNPAPEPASLLLIAPGLGALLFLRRKKRQSEKNS